MGKLEAQMNHVLSPYKALYPQSDVYVLGGSKKLLQCDVNALKNKVCIGTNSSYLFKNDCSFFIAGHLIWGLLWSLFARPEHTCVYHGEPKNLKLSRITSVTKRLPIQRQFLDRLGDDDILLGNDMVAFSATHLAVLIGAKRIIYMGFDAKDRGHFYSTEPHYSTFKKHLDKVMELYPKHKYHAQLMLTATYPSEKPSTTSNMFKRYSQILNKYELLFGRLKELGITPYTTEKESIILEAGGERW